MEDRRRFWIGFSLAAGIGPAKVGALLGAFGDVEAAWNAPAWALARVPGIGPQSVRILLEARARLDLDRELDRVETQGLGLLTWDDPDYPARLREIDSSPPVLYVAGALAQADRYTVAIVGTRRASEYGLSVTGEIASHLAREGVTVVSGLARGIDAAAHRAALASGGRTLAVLGSGLDQVYPPEHRKLAEEIAARGAVLSDYPLGTLPEPGNFPPRNRIISGLSLAVVVVEAGESSGALITADFAADQGREVFAVPGSIRSLRSRGTNRLIRAGASPLLSPADVLEALDLEVAARQELAVQPLPEDDTERRVLTSLAVETLHIDELRARCDLPAAEVASALAMLEIKGRVRCLGGMTYVRIR